MEKAFEAQMSASTTVKSQEAFKELTVALGQVPFLTDLM